jgi:hypothetical protein
MPGPISSTPTPVFAPQASAILGATDGLTRKFWPIDFENVNPYRESSPRTAALSVSSKAHLRCRSAAAFDKTGFCFHKNHRRFQEIFKRFLCLAGLRAAACGLKISGTPNASQQRGLYHDHQQAG